MSKIVKLAGEVLTSKLNISRVTGSEARWQNIANLFNQKATKAKHELHLYGSFDEGIDLQLRSLGGTKSFEEACISDVASHKLAGYKDDTIVNKLLKIFKCLESDRNITEIGSKFYAELSKVSPEVKANPSKFWDDMVDLMWKEKDRIKGKDKFLNMKSDGSNFDVLL